MLLRPFHWKSIPLGEFQVLPRNQRPVTDSIWHSIDEALLTVVQEIREVLHTMQPEEGPAHQPRRHPTDSPLHSKRSSQKSSSLNGLGITLLILLLLSLAIGEVLLRQGKIGVGLTNTSASPISSPIIRSTPIPTSQEKLAEQQYSLATSGSATIDDPLNGQTSSQWDRDPDCNFRDGGYHVTGQTTYASLASCSFSGQFQDFAFQADMTLLKGAGGGLLFRKAGSSFGYRFFLGRNFVDLTYDGS